MFLLIAQNHQDLFSIFKSRVHREYADIYFIINENKNRRINENNLQDVHDFLLNNLSNKWNIFFEKRINELSNKCEINNEDSIKNTRFNKFANVNDVLTKESIQNFNYFCCVWRSFFNVTNKIDHSQSFTTELRFFFRKSCNLFFQCLSKHRSIIEYASWHNVESQKK
jgi:hypothetical protein